MNNNYTVKDYNTHYIPLTVIYGRIVAERAALALTNKYQCKKTFYATLYANEAYHIYCNEKLTARQIDNAITFVEGFEAGRRSY